MFMEKPTVEQHLPLVKRIARRLCGPHVEFDDLVQEGSIELMKVIERWDGVRTFSSYAGICIAGAMRHYIRDKACSVKHPRGKEQKVLSLNTPVHNEDERWELMDLLSSPLEEEIPDYEVVLTHLSPKQKDIFHKYFLNNERIADIAKARRVSVLYIHRQVKAIKEKLKQHL